MDLIEIQAQNYLLVRVGGGRAVHLALPRRGADEVEGTTLCGRVWGGHADEEAPNCGRCLTSIDLLFPTPTPDARIDLVAALVVAALRRHGYAEVVGVPGDQLPALRRTIRQRIRDTLGFKSNTYVVNGRLFVVSDEAYAPHAQRHRESAAAAMNTLFAGEEAPPIDDTEWRFHWSARGTA